MTKEEKKTLKAETAVQGEKLHAVMMEKLSAVAAVKERACGDESDEALAVLAETDADAAAIMAIRSANAMDPVAAKPYILQGLVRNSVICANFVEGCTEYGTIDFDDDDIVLALVVSEQFYDDANGKKIFKFYNGSEQLRAYIDCADRHVLATAVTDAVLPVYSADRYEKIRLKAERTYKRAPVRDYKNSFILSVELFAERDSEVPDYEKYGVYVFHPREANQDPQKQVLTVLEKIKNLIVNDLADFKFAVKEIDLLGTVYAVADENRSDDSADRANFHAKKGTIEDEEVDLKVKMSQESLVQGMSCPHCGTVLNRAGRCESCGYEAEPAANEDGDTLRIHIRESMEEKAHTILSCTQCGGSIAIVDEQAAFAVCPFCGSNFALNERALGLISQGLDFQSMEADKPKQAEMPSFRFVSKALLDGKLGVVMPDCFDLMDERMKAIKYPKGNPPQIVFTDNSGKTNFTFNVQYETPVKEGDIPNVGKSILSAFRKMMQAATFGESGLLPRGDDKNVFAFELITPGADTSIYNYMAQFCLSGKLVNAAFNCVAEDRWYWSHIFKLAARSLKFDD